MKIKIECISDFFYPERVEIYENIDGTCVVCGRETEIGREIDYSANFTKWNLLNAGDCICPHCYELTRNQDYRRSMWIAARDGITKFKKKDMLTHILNPPAPPFAMYLTRTWQKQGFFKLISNGLNYSRENYTTALDMQVIHVNLPKAKRMANIAQNGRKKGLTKEELETGNIAAHRYKQNKISLQLVEQIKQNAHQKLWRLIVYAID